MNQQDYTQSLIDAYQPKNLQGMSIEELQQAIETVRTEMRKQARNEDYLLMFGFFTDLTVRLEFKIYCNNES